MVRKVISDKIKYEPYLYMGESPAITIDFSDGINGFHDITDMEAVSNIICKTIINKHGGEYNDANGVGTTTIGGIKFKIIADSMCGWVEIIQESNLNVVRTTNLIISVSELLLSTPLIYKDNDKNINLGGVDFE